MPAANLAEMHTAPHVTPFCVGMKLQSQASIFVVHVILPRSGYH